ncbi:MAG: serine hydrolase domain-containing protein [Ancrocorticia sp.]
MTTDIAIRKNVDRLHRIRSTRYPETPIALVSGPRVELSVGDPDQPFWIASVDKVFIATLIAQLFDEGHCSPDSRIGDVLPAAEVALLPTVDGVDAGRDITVQHLLSHTAGLPDIMLPPRGHHSACSIKQIQAAPERVWTTPEMLSQVEHLPAIARPGESFLYGDTAYLLLIRTLEEARGQRFGEQLRDRIFELSGMTTSAEWASSDAESLQPLAQKLAPFWLDKTVRGNPQDFAPNLTWRSGIGGVSTANDLVRFQQTLHTGNLCDLKWLELMSTPRNRLRPGIHYGTGMVTLRFGGFSPWMHRYPQPIGGLGYTAIHMFYYPQQRTHLILNFHAHARMRKSFMAHIRLAQLIKDHG